MEYTKLKCKGKEDLVINFCKENGFITGSYAFGYKNNDIDIVVESDKLENFCHKFDYSYHPTWYVGIDNSTDFDFMDLKFKSKEINYDIIIVNRSEYKIWRYSTAMMLLFLKDCDLYKKYSNKENRVKVFEKLKSYYRGVFSKNEI